MHSQDTSVCSAGRRQLRIASALLLIQGILMEGVVFLGLLVLLVLGIDQAVLTDRVTVFSLGYLNENLYLMMGLSGIFAALRITGALGMLRNRLWAFALSLINCVVTLTLMIFMLPAGLLDGILTGTALIFMLRAWCGDRVILPNVSGERG